MLHRCPLSRIDPNSRRHGEPSAALIPRYRHTCCYETRDRAGRWETRDRAGRWHPEFPAGGRGYAGLRCDGGGPHPRRLPNGHVGWGGGPVAAPVRSGCRGVLRALGIPVMARSRRGRPRTAPSARHRPLSAVPVGAHHAGLSLRRCGDPDSVAGGQPRQPHRLAGQPDPHAGLCAAHPHGGSDPDVEPVGGGEFLPGATDPGLSGLPASRTCPGTGDRGSGGGQPRVGTAAHPHPDGGELSQLAAGLRLLVRRRNAARGMDGESDRLGAPTGPQPGGHYRGRGGRLLDLGIAVGRAGGSGARHAGSVRGANLHGGHCRRGAAGPACARSS